MALHFELLNKRRRMMRKVLVEEAAYVLKDLWKVAAAWTNAADTSQPYSNIGSKAAILAGILSRINSGKMFEMTDTEAAILADAYKCIEVIS